MKWKSQKHLPHTRNFSKSLLSSSGPGLGHCLRLFSKTGLNSCLKRTRAEAIIQETPTHHPPTRNFSKTMFLVYVFLGSSLVYYSNTKDSETPPLPTHTLPPKHQDRLLDRLLKTPPPQLFKLFVKVLSLSIV